jgi:hypothetical protein
MTSLWSPKVLTMENKLKKKLLEEYEDKEQLYKEFASLVRNVLDVFIAGLGLKYQIFDRPKHKDKLGEKIDRKRREGKKYKKLDDIEDLDFINEGFHNYCV